MRLLRGTPHDGACTRAKVAAVASLFQQGADPAAVDNFGQTALHLACRRAGAETVAALCRGGAPPWPRQVVWHRQGLAQSPRQGVER